MSTAPLSSITTDPTPSVSLRGLTKVFGGSTVVDDLDLDIASGEFFSLLGPSGCGKTTTLRMIAGFSDPTSGTVLVGGEDVTSTPPHKRDVNTVFQSYALFEHLDVRGNVGFGLRRRGLDKRTRDHRVSEMLELVELGDRGKEKPSRLSGGQRQRVALARALINQPKVLLLDEPLAALDLKLRHAMQAELKAIQREVGITFLHVTHDQDEAMSMADAIAVMNEGRIEQLGSPEELYERPRTAFVARFLGACNLLEGDRVGQDAGVRIGVRPEKMRLVAAGQAPPGNGAVLRGRVTDASFLGIVTEYVVRTDDGAELMVVAQNDGSAELQTLGPGREVDVFWNPSHSFVVDKEPAHAP
jgi:spermidine/putrescine transport system ATP-binding protein